MVPILHMDTPHYMLCVHVSASERKILVSCSYVYLRQEAVVAIHNVLCSSRAVPTLLSVQTLRNFADKVPSLLRSNAYPIKLFLENITVYDLRLQWKFLHSFWIDTHARTHTHTHTHTHIYIYIYIFKKNVRMYIYIYIYIIKTNKLMSQINGDSQNYYFYISANSTSQD